MKDSEKIAHIKYLVDLNQNFDKGYFKIAHIAACLLPKHLGEQLEQLVNGPVWDGDIISKSCRGQLFECGLAIRVCKNGEQGFTGATYFAYSVLDAFKQIEAGKIPA
jgi:hypothetical protein